MKKIGVLTSGGDAPGMNACIRAVVRCAIDFGLKVIGIRHGYNGLIREDLVEMDLRSVSGIINTGGTILHTARSEEFRTAEGRKKAYEVVCKNKIDGLVIIGGDGSFKGAAIFNQEYNIPSVGIPGTIDNDIYGTDYTLGFDTAVNTALEAVDKIRDTAVAHDRLFLIEVMGRHSGLIALYVALAGGAEDVLIPETPTNLKEICDKLKQGKSKGKSSSILIIAEGDECGGAFDIAEKIKDKTGYQVRVSVLGYQQRGGSPTAFDRILAARLGYKAIEVLLAGERDKIVGMIGNKIVTSDINISWEKKKPIDQQLIKLQAMLAK